jgi:hypothetical protein
LKEIRREYAKLLERIFLFAKKLRMEKPDSKLLKMLLPESLEMVPNKFSAKQFSFPSETLGTGRRQFRTVCDGVTHVSCLH